jgi:hypothetical protein
MVWTHPSGAFPPLGWAIFTVLSLAGLPELMRMEANGSGVE